MIMRLSACMSIAATLVFLCGCETSRHLPRSLKGEDRSQLVRVLNHRSTQSSLKSIDGQSVGAYSPLLYYVSPGKHVYRVEVELSNTEVQYLGKGLYRLQPAGTLARQATRWGGRLIWTARPAGGGLVAVSSDKTGLAKAADVVSALQTEHTFTVRAEAGQSLRFADHFVPRGGLEFSWKDGAVFPIEKFVRPDITTDVGANLPAGSSPRKGGG